MFTVGFDRADVQAHLRDLEALFWKYGAPEDVQPHNQAALEAELKRAGETLIACALIEPKPKPVSPSGCR